MKGWIYFYLMGIVTGGLVMGMWITRNELKPPTYIFPTPPVAEVPYPVALSFGKTIIGNGTVLMNDYFSSPVLIVGNDVMVAGSVFKGNDFGLYLAGDARLWMRESIVIDSQIGITSNAKVSITGVPTLAGDYPLVLYNSIITKAKEGK